QEGGGTEIFGAVDEGLRRMLEVDAARRHIILLTDGQSATNLSYDTLTREMNESQITMSTVAIGDGADQTLLQTLAEKAGGRYYFTNDESTLPTIFSQEAVLMS